MGVQPHSAAAGHGNPGIDLAIEEVRHGVRRQRLTVAKSQTWRTSCTSSIKSRSSAAEMPKPPTSVSPASRRKSSLAQAVGLNRRAGLSLRSGSGNGVLSQKSLSDHVRDPCVVCRDSGGNGPLSRQSSQNRFWQSRQDFRQAEQNSQPQIAAIAETPATKRLRHSPGKECEQPSHSTASQR